MITELHIQNFRGLKDVTLSGLSRVNLIVGGNDTGKTSVLEALMILFSDGVGIRKLPGLFRSREEIADANGDQHSNPIGKDDLENFWLWLFFDRYVNNTINIQAKMQPSAVHVLSELKPEQPRSSDRVGWVISRDVGDGHGFVDLIRYEYDKVNIFGVSPPSNARVSLLSTHATSPVRDAELFNEVAQEGQGEEQIESIMRAVEPRVKRLRYSKLSGTPALIYVDVGLSRRIPATQMGQAFNRLLHIYCEILASKANVLLIDEIENGIYSESLPLIWKGLFAVCEEQDVQIFATTHSRECVMAANAAAAERGKGEELSLQRLQFVKGQLEAVHLEQRHLNLAAKMDLEVRS